MSQLLALKETLKIVFPLRDMQIVTKSASRLPEVFKSFIFILNCSRLLEVRPNCKWFWKPKDSKIKMIIKGLFLWFSFKSRNTWIDTSNTGFYSLKNLKTDQNIWLNVTEFDVNRRYEVAGGVHGVECGSYGLQLFFWNVVPMAGANANVDPQVVSTWKK